jgi:hypothetical protein
MAIRCGTCSITPLVAIIGLAGLGYAGFNYIAGDCCPDPGTTAALASTPAPSDDSPCCPSGAEKTAVTAEGDHCAASQVTKTTANGSETCHGEAAAECPYMKEHCSGQSPENCPSPCEGETKAEGPESIAKSGGN